MIPEEEVEPPQKRTELSLLQHVPFQPSFLSLPNEIIVNCFARISKSYYPSLSLVSKTFRYLVSSQELDAARYVNGTTEICLYICLRFSTVPYTEPTQRWFNLWVKPDRSLTDGRSKEKSSGNLFVPCLNYSPPHSLSTVTVGSEIYVIGGPMNDNLAPSSAFRVYNTRTRTWRDLPNMKTERRCASTCVLDDKIYVMGGCAAWRGEDSWSDSEMFDLKTQTWNSLPKYPDIMIRLGLEVRKINVMEGKIYVKTDAGLKDGVYDVKEGRWSIADERLSRLWSNSWCVIENVMYCYSWSGYMQWYDLEARTWREVMGLKALKRYRSYSTDYRNCMVELVNYGGKLAILWDRFERRGRSQNKNIWCAMVALQRCYGNHILGMIEWVDVVLTVPKSYEFVNCLALSV